MAERQGEHAVAVILRGKTTSPETAYLPENAAEQATAPCEQLEIGVLVVDDSQIMREGLVSMLDIEPGIRIVGEGADGPAAIELAEKLQPDVILMQFNLVR